LGVVTALILGYFLFSGAKRIPVKLFFKITTVFLAFFAADLLAEGLHELGEAGWFFELPETLLTVLVFALYLATMFFVFNKTPKLQEPAA
jgi:hypothetical protein